MGLNTVTASAPGRCGIVGNPSDIYGGKVLACSLPARATCKLTLGAESLPEDLTLWNAATARFPIEGSVSVEWSSEVPRSSGLAGSTALLAATLACVMKIRGDAELSSVDFAEMVRDIERHEACVMCGYQDAYMVVHGGLRLMDFSGKHPVNPGPPAHLKSLSALLPFLLITTGVQRLSGSVHSPMAERWLAGEPLVVSTMETLAALAPLAAQALAAQDYSTLGEAMNENQRLIAQLGGSGESIDHLIGLCIRHGASAAKLAGAGMGGTVIALTENPNELQTRLEKEGYNFFIRPEIAPGLQVEF